MKKKLIFGFMSNTFQIRTNTTGFSSPAENYVDKRLNPLDVLVKNPFTTFFLRASGNKYTITDGDILVVDKSISPEEDKLVIIENNNRLEIIKFNSNSNNNVWGVITHVIKTL